MQNTVHWFRTKGLRLHDNPSLVESTKSADSLRCIFILDPFFPQSGTKGVNNWKFLLESLTDLDANLRKYNSRLFVVRGQPADVIPKLIKEWKISCLSFEQDPEPFGTARDQNIVRLCAQLGITVVTDPSHTLYATETFPRILTYRQFLSVLQTLPPPPEPIPAPLRLPHTPIQPQFNSKFSIPSLQALGFEPIKGQTVELWRGGESEGFRRLEQISLQAHTLVPSSPNGSASATSISPYLCFGCISPRLFYYRIKETYCAAKTVDDPPPLSVYEEIFWREFLYHVASQNPNFDKMQGNPLCLQIPWNQNPSAVWKWTHAQTGFPLIDAIMTQLRAEGWISPQFRHAAASFLTRGHLWISWEEGMKVFDELLLDADLTTNVGSWLWFSGSSFFQPFFHALCPVRFGKKVDPKGDYIRKYIPALRGFPDEFIHAPWTASEQTQTAAECVIGTDYPVPIVNHVTASNINADKMRQVVASLSNYKTSVN